MAKKMRRFFKDKFKQRELPSVQMEHVNDEDKVLYEFDRQGFCETDSTRIAEMLIARGYTEVTAPLVEATNAIQ